MDVVDRIGLVLPPNRHILAYLQTKARRSGHLIGELEPEQAEPTTVDAA